jgi:hypothetical protein
MNKKRFRVVMATLVLLLSAVGTVSAQSGTETPPPCSGDMVSGTLVSVDQTTGTATILTESGECTVALNSEYNHPIVQLFDDFFGSNDSGTGLQDKLNATQAYAVYDETTGVWTLAAEGTEGAVPVRVTAVEPQPDGTYLVTLVNDQGETVTTVVTDPAEAATLDEALQALKVDWSIVSGPDGAHVQDVGDEIAAYHSDGMGFGVLLKLKAMVQESKEACMSEDSTDSTACNMTMESLVQEFKSGTGMGELFKEYGKPALLGIGHIRQEMKNQEQNTETQQFNNGKDKSNNGKSNNANKPDKENNGKKNK